MSTTAMPFLHTCSNCKRPLPLREFMLVKRGYGWRGPDASYRYSWCYECNRAHAKAYYEKNREKRLRAFEERRQMRRSVPALLAEDREYHRMWAWGRRRALGIEETTSRRKRVTDREKSPELDAEPFAAWLDSKLAEYGTVQLLSDVTGLEERTLLRLRSRSARHVRLDTVDRALTNEGSTFLWDLYPHLYAFEDEEAAV